MSDKLSAKKQTIEGLFKIEDKNYIIPEYQRPYSWGKELCEALWNDLVEFAESPAAKKTDSYYFLGTIVSYENDENNLEVIDGQQRITSLLLMLRAFYHKLEGMDTDDDEVVGLMTTLGECIWKVNKMSKKVKDKTKVHVVSRVASKTHNEIFHKILETGNSDINAKDNYSQNYQLFQSKYNDYVNKNPNRWKDLCLNIIQGGVVLPILCSDQETALTIFSKLNDSGLPLTDSDIFKAKLYRYYSEDYREWLLENWDDLTEICEKAGFKLDDVFQYYMRILLAKENDKSTTKIGLRKFYADDGSYKRLEEKNLIENIVDLANFWYYVNKLVEPEDECYKFSISNWQYLHCLLCYSNELWKLVVSVFFIKNKENKNFSTEFDVLLKKLIAYLFVKYIEMPNADAVKSDIYNACISIYHNNKFIDFSLDDKAIDLLKNKISDTNSTKIAKPLLLLHAYLNPNQTDLIPNKFQIEHILPKKWKTANYNGWTEEDAKEYMDYFGNKVVIEKKPNIQAGNKYFGRKKEDYKKSGIANVLDLSKYKEDDWFIEDIEKREKIFINDLIKFFKEQLPPKKENEKVMSKSSNKKKKR